jgi:hypothetical protein
VAGLSAAFGRLKIDSCYITSRKEPRVVSSLEQAPCNNSQKGGKE